MGRTITLRGEDAKAYVENLRELMSVGTPNPSRPKKPKYQIHSDGITVWVNGEEENIARFGRYGIDIHKPGGGCLFCTHGIVKARDWHLFVEKMKELYNIRVGERFRPKRLR